MNEERASTPVILETAEQAVIGAILIDAACLGDVLTAVRDEDFPGKNYRRIFTAARALFNEGKPVDIVTIIDKAGPDLRDLAVGCMEVTPTAANVLHYCSILREQAALDRLRGAAADLYGAQSMAEAADAMATAESIITDRPGVSVASITDIMANFLTRMSAPAPDYIKWGLELMDGALHTAPGHYVLLGARPSTGKTALALQVGLNMAKTKRVGFFSLETGMDTAGDRIAASTLPVRLPDIKARRITPEYMKTMVEAMGTTGLTSRTFDFITGASMSVAEIKSVAMARRHEVVIIDYVQLIRPTVRGDRQEQMQDVSIQLRAMAQLTGVVIIAIAQLRRPPTGAENKAPTMADLKESGQFEQDADTIMLMYLDDPKNRNGPRCIKIEKNKDGPAGLMRRFNFDGEHQRFDMIIETQRTRSQFKELDDNEQYTLPEGWG